MTTEEFRKEAKEAAQYCVRNNLWRSQQEIEELKASGGLAKMAIIRMNLHKKRQEELRKSK